MKKNDEKEENILILSLSDKRLKKVTQVLSNETAVKIVEKLLERSMSSTELAEALDMPLTTVKYNLDALVEAELIKVKYSGFSKKGREVKYYAPVRRVLVLMPEKKESEVIAFLKKTFIAILILILSIPIGLTLQQSLVNSSLGGGEHEVVLLGKSFLFWWLIGVVFALFTYILIDTAIGLRRKQKKTSSE